MNTNTTLNPVAWLEAVMEKTARIPSEQVVGSCVIVRFVAPGVETTYGVLYENKEPAGSRPNTKYGFPFGGIEPTLEKTTWENAMRELLEELFDAPFAEIDRQIAELEEKLPDAEQYGTTADSPEEIEEKIAALRKEREAATLRAPEVTILEKHFIDEFTIKNDRGTRLLHFVVFSIEMPADTSIYPGKEQFEAHKLTAAEIESLIADGEFFYHQADAWERFKAWQVKNAAIQTEQ